MVARLQKWSSGPRAVHPFQMADICVSVTEGCVFIPGFAPIQFDLSVDDDMLLSRADLFLKGYFQSTLMY
jgi:hypothetical protein